MAAPWQRRRAKNETPAAAYPAAAAPYQHGVSWRQQHHGESIGGMAALKMAKAALMESAKLKSSAAAAKWRGIAVSGMAKL